MIRFLRLWCIVAVLVALPAMTSAVEVSEDFDRDGQRDVVSVDPGLASVVRVYLSATKTVHVLRVDRPVVKFGVFDLDGDGHPELLVSDTSAKVHVWRSNSRGKLRPYAPRRHPPEARSSPATTVAEDADDIESPLQTTLRLVPPFDSPHRPAGGGQGHDLALIEIVARRGLDSLTASRTTRGPPSA